MPNPSSIAQDDELREYDAHWRQERREHDDDEPNPPLTRVSFYVATAFGNRVNAAYAANELEDMGHIITHKWWLAESKYDTPTAAQRVRMAMADIDGAASADITLVLDHEGIYGGLIEAGIALGAGRVVWVVAPRRSEDFFWNTSYCVVFPTVEEALQAADEL